MGSLGTPCGKIRYKGQVPGCNSHCTYSKGGSGEEEETEAGEEEAQADVEEDRVGGGGGNASSSHPFQLQAVQGM